MQLTLPVHRARTQEPARDMLVFGGRRTSRGTFADRVARLAAGLASLGVKPGDRVGMLALNSDRYIEYFYGVWWLGAALNPVNIRWNPIEIAYSLDDCDTRTLLIDDAFAGMVPELRKRSASLHTLVYCGEGPCPEGMADYESLIAAAQPLPDARRGGGDLAAVMYTGGTTGRPKGVMLSHTALFVNQLGSLATIPRRSPEVISLFSTPMFHIAGLAYAIQHVMRLDRLVLIPAFAAAGVIAAIERERVTETFLVPTMLRFMLDDPSFEGADLASLELLLYGAAPMDSALLDRALAALPGVGFVHVYGMTELAPVVSALGASYHTKAGQAAGKLRSAGRPLLTAEVRIVDAEGRPVPTGTVGEITVRGPIVMDGYWNRPAETTAALRDGWMHTGDGGWFDEDGFLTIADRIKDMIITGGENVFSAEVENAISTLPGVAMCAVVAVPDERYGEAVHAIVVPEPGAQFDAQGVIAHCRTLIAGFKCPRTVEFRTELPLSPVGKLLKYQLRAEIRERQLAAPG